MRCEVSFISCIYPRARQPRPQQRCQLSEDVTPETHFHISSSSGAGRGGGRKLFSIWRRLEARPLACSSLQCRPAVSVWIGTSCRAAQMHPGTAATEPAAVWPCDHARVSKVPGTQQGADSAHKEFRIRSLPRPRLLLSGRGCGDQDGWITFHIKLCAAVWHRVTTTLAPASWAAYCCQILYLLYKSASWSLSYKLHRFTIHIISRAHLDSESWYAAHTCVWIVQLNENIHKHFQISCRQTNACESRRYSKRHKRKVHRHHLNISQTPLLLNTTKQSELHTDSHTFRPVLCWDWR